MAQDISKMETTQTAVEWLIQELELEGYPFIIKLAKEMEKEQMIDFAKQWQERQNDGNLDTIEMLYNETYNK